MSLRGARNGVPEVYAARDRAALPTELNMGRGDSNGVSIREALVLWAVLILAVLRWSKPAAPNAHPGPDRAQAASVAPDVHPGLR